MSGMLKIRFMHHASFFLELNGAKLLIDPFLNFPSEIPEKPKTVFPECKIKPDAVLVTHEHFDHFDKQFIEELSKQGSVIVAHYNILSQLNVARSKKYAIDIKTRLNLKGVSIEAFQVHHPTAFYPLGFKITANNFSIIHFGDTFLMPLFSKLKADLLLIPIGGFTTMDTIDAVKIVKSIQPKYAIPMHYNTFSKIKANPEEFASKIEKSSVETKPIILEPSEEFRL